MKQQKMKQRRRSPPSLYILLDFENHIKGVYTSIRQLHIGVNYWIKELPDESLTWTEYEANYSPEPLSWDYAYISNVQYDHVRKLAKKGGVSFFPVDTNVNLVNRKNDRRIEP